MNQAHLDLKNVEFWEELCGSWLARSLDISEVSAASLRRFDSAYLALYPYLYNYVTLEALKDKQVLEIGLGYGTLGQLLAAQGCDYYGLDIAQGPVAMMQYRLAQLGLDPKEKIKMGSALNIPHPDSSFDFVYSIGCLHHTGNLEKSVSEVYRVLKAGGVATIMLYNRHSFRQLFQIPLSRLRHGFLQNSLPGKDWSKQTRALYDANQEGEAAPYTEYVSKSDVKQLFRSFAEVKIDIQNFDGIHFGNRVVLRREWLLNNLGRILGLDLYIVAKK